MYMRFEVLSVKDRDIDAVLYASFQLAISMCYLFWRASLNNNDKIILQL